MTERDYHQVLTAENAATPKLQRAQKVNNWHYAFSDLTILSFIFNNLELQIGRFGARTVQDELEKPRSKKHATKLDQIDQTADKVRERNTTEAALEGKKRVKHYDVFFCYSRRDKENVRAIGSKLSDRGIRPFIDETSILPGEKWTTAVGEQLENLRAAVVFLGGGGMTDWATIEAEALIEKAKLRDRPLIPVFLPSCASDFELPWIFTGRNPVDFRKLMPEPIDELIRGIRGWDDS